MYEKKFEVSNICCMFLAASSSLNILDLQGTAYKKR